MAAGGERDGGAEVRPLLAGSGLRPHCPQHADPAARPAEQENTIRLGERLMVQPRQSCRRIGNPVAVGTLKVGAVAALWTEIARTVAVGIDHRKTRLAEAFGPVAIPRSDCAAGVSQTLAAVHAHHDRERSLAVRQIDISLERALALADLDLLGTRTCGGISQENEGRSTGNGSGGEASHRGSRIHAPYHIANAFGGLGVVHDVVCGLPATQLRTPMAILALERPGLRWWQSGLASRTGATIFAASVLPAAPPRDRFVSPHGDVTCSIVSILARLPKPRSSIWTEISGSCGRGRSCVAP